MEVFIRYGSTFASPEYSCSGVDACSSVVREQRGVRNIFFGCALLAVGVITEVLTIACIVVFSGKKYFRLSSYKILLCLMLNQGVATVLNCIVTGIFHLNGIFFCSFPDFIFILGCLINWLFASSTSTCLILLVSRFIEIVSPRLMKALFSGNRIFFWLDLSQLHGLFFFFMERSALFSSYSMAWVYDPQISTEDKRMVYRAEFMNINNIVCSCLYVLCYALNFWARRNYKLIYNQAEVLSQSLGVCLCVVATSLVYIYMQYGPSPLVVTVVAHCVYAASTVSPALLFTLSTPQVRSLLLSVLCIRGSSSYSPSTRAPAISIIS